MAETIWKKVLEVTNFQRIEVPVGAEFLIAREQHGDVCVWYKCDPEASLEKRGIFIYGTGHMIDPVSMRYLGSAYLANGNLVLHVFERL